MRQSRLVLLIVLLLPLSAAAQERVWRVGLLSNGGAKDLTGSSSGQQSGWRDELLLALDQAGYRLGRNLELVDRYSDGHVDRLEGFAREIAAAGVDLAVAVSDPGVRAMIAATDATPIVMVVGDDPVARGLVASMARPGGRVTGLAFQTLEGDVKRLALLREAMPNARRFGRLGPPGPVPARGAELLVAAARQLNIELKMRAVARLESTEYAAAFAEMRDEGVAGVLIAASQAWASDWLQLGRIAQEQGLATVCEWEYMARRGGCVLAYGHDLVYAYRRAGWYAVRILKGATPAELPVEEPDAWKLTINLQAAARVGLAVLPALLARADEVIE